MNIQTHALHNILLQSFCFNLTHCFRPVKKWQLLGVGVLVRLTVWFKALTELYGTLHCARP